MFDAALRPLIDPPLNRMGAWLAAKGVRATTVTLAGFLMGLVAMAFILNDNLKIAAVFVVLNRLLDGLDGAVARHTRLTDFGGFLDIVCDFITYSGIVFAFGWGHPDRLAPASFLVFSFIGPITAFLAYAILAAKHQHHTDKRGKKSFYYLGGICEGTETAVVLVALCLLPQFFAPICWVYGALCWVTTLGRVRCAWVDYGRI